MSANRKILFTFTTLFLLIAIAEGTAQLIWWQLQERAFAVTKAAGEKALRNDAINFMKQADGTFGYVLKPGFDRGGTYINADGFAQRESVALPRTSETLRIAALGESTTQGHNVDNGNYPFYLRQLIKKNSSGYTNIEMINGGVAGWVSDQIALWAEKKIAAYQPNIVVLYVGWNDFQTYNPFSAPRAVSDFDRKSRGVLAYVESSPLKSITLASAAYANISRKFERRRLKKTNPTELRQMAYTSEPSVNYKFYLRNMDRILVAFREANPGVQTVVCTLVGRWPNGTEADFTSDLGATWWMKQHHLTPVQAASALDRFNALIRDYAKSRGLILIDAAEGFANLDRSKLQSDFAHLTSEGYELLAEVMYERLRSAGIVNGAPSARLAQLHDKYRVKRH